MPSTSEYIEIEEEIPISIKDEEFVEESDEFDFALTTIDNPFDPFTQWDEWYAFDQGKGYYTCEYLSRMVGETSYLSPNDEDYAIALAIKEICDLNILGIYKYVKRPKDKTIVKSLEEAIKA